MFDSSPSLLVLQKLMGFFGCRFRLDQYSLKLNDGETSVRSIAEISGDVPTEERSRIYT